MGKWSERDEFGRWKISLRFIHDYGKTKSARVLMLKRVTIAIKPMHCDWHFILCSRYRGGEKHFVLCSCTAVCLTRLLERSIPGLVSNYDGKRENIDRNIYQNGEKQSRAQFLIDSSE